MQFLSEALLLGGITSEMMLGHWFLVDPRLPRWALKRLAIAGGAGAALDLGAMAILGAFPWQSGDVAVGLGFVLLVVTTVILCWAVYSSLGEEGYPAVMAATGLSYLAVLVCFGVVTIGRVLIVGPS